jgi:hypothetical protein
MPDEDLTTEIRKLGAQLRMAIREYHNAVLTMVEEEVHDPADLKRIQARLRRLSKRADSWKSGA